LNSLYSSPDNGEGAEFDLAVSIEEAVMTIPENLMGLSFSDPMGIEIGDLTDIAMVAEDQEVDTSIFGNLKSNFVTGHAAFSYLIFILLYTPCVAAMGAYMKEFGRKYAAFIASWTMLLAYTGAALYYNVMHFSAQPVTSASWIVGVLVVWIGTYFLLKKEGQKQMTLTEAMA